ncbi:MAG: xylulokinase [Victivallales bacterium]
MKKNLLLGIDFGTGGCKVTLINSKGKYVTGCSGEYSTSHPVPGWAEQNPSDWYLTMCRVLKELNPERYGKVIALSLDSYTHGAVLLDANMRVIRPTIIWTDQRSVSECEFLNKHYRDLVFKTAYQMPAPTWTLPQMLWLRNNESDTLSKVRHISFVKDYIRFLLTGNMTVDYIEAQGTLFFDVENRCWSKRLCEIAGIDINTLPPIVTPADLAGKLSRQAAADTGLEAGIKVITGTSDSAIEDYAAGAVEPGQCILKLATAGNVNVMTAKAHPHPETLTYSHVVPGMWYTVTATNAAAVCQRWFRDNCCAAGTDYDSLDRLAAQSPSGANGVFFHPYLMGERSPYWDPDLRGSFTGLSMASGKGDLNRALLEGVAFSLKDCFRTIEKMALPVHEFILIGGGAKSNLWSRIVCDVFNAPVKVPAVCDASFGSALLAGVGIGVFADELSAIRQGCKTDKELLPDAANAAFYAAQFEKYRKIHDVLVEVYG